MNCCSVYLDLCVSSGGCLHSEVPQNGSYPVFACLINMGSLSLLSHLKAQGCNMSRSCDSTKLLSNIGGGLLPTKLSLTQTLTTWLFPVSPKKPQHCRFGLPSEHFIQVAGSRNYILALQHKAFCNYFP